MTLLEMAAEYRRNVAVLQGRSALLRSRMRRESDPAERERLMRRIRNLQALCREGRQLAALMEQYYERGPHHERP